MKFSHEFYFHASFFHAFYFRAAPFFSFSRKTNFRATAKKFYLSFDEDFSHFSQLFQKSTEKNNSDFGERLYGRLAEEKHPHYLRTYYVHKIL